MGDHMLDGFEPYAGRRDPYQQQPLARIADRAYHHETGYWNPAATAGPLNHWDESDLVRVPQWCQIFDRMEDAARRAVETQAGNILLSVGALRFGWAEYERITDNSPIAWFAEFGGGENLESHQFDWVVDAAESAKSDAERGGYRDAIYWLDNARDNYASMQQQWNNFLERSQELASDTADALRVTETAADAFLDDLKEMASN